MSPRPRALTALSWRAWCRQLRDAPSVPLALAVATFVLVGCLSLAPRVVDRASQDDLRVQLESARPDQRNLRFERSTRIGVSPVGDGMDTVRREGTELLDDAPETITSVVTSQRFVIDSPRFDVTSYPDEDRGLFPTTIVFRTQEDVESELTLVAGDLPLPQPVRWLLRGSECPTDVAAEEYGRDPYPDIDCDVVTAPVFDTLLSVETAALMGLEAGDEAILFPDPRDLPWRQATGQQFGRRFILRVAGIVELSDPESEYWYGDTSLHRPRLTENADYRLIYATGLLDAGGYQDFLRATVSVPLRYAWRSNVDIDRIDSQDAGELADDVEALAPRDTDVVTQLPDLLREHLDQRSITIGVMSAVVSGLFVAALGGLAALALAGAMRRRATYRVVVERGATDRQVVGDGVRTAALVVGPAAVAAWFAAKVAVPDARDALSVWTGVAAGAVAAAVVATASSAGSIPRRRPTRTSGRLTRRLVVEALLVVLAVGAVVLLRRRGEVAGAGRDFDPLLSVTAAIAATAVAVLAARVAPPLTRGVARAAARRRGAVGFVGTRIASSGARVMSPTFVVMVGAVAIATFAAVIGASVERTQESRSWAAVGGDYRIESLNATAPLAQLVDLEALTPAGDAADAVVTEDVSAVGPAGATFVQLSAVPLDAYLDDVIGERSDVVDTELLELLRDATTAWDPTSEAPIPALLSSRWPASTAIRPGDQFSMDLVGTGPQTYEALAVVDDVIGTEAARPAVLVDLSALEIRTGPQAEDANLRIGSASGADVERLVADAAAVDTVVVTSRYEALDQIAGDPFATWMRRTWTAVIALSTAVAALAAVSSFEITSNRRDRALTVMRTLGLRRRETAGVVAVEQAPIVVFTVVLGCVAGIVVAWALHPALRLERLAGGDEAAPPTVAVAQIGAVAFGVAVAIAVAIAIAVWRLVRRNDASMLRTGDDR